MTPKSVSDFYYYNHPEYRMAAHGAVSFSQEGEDMVLRRVFSNIQHGIYIDIGAHHPSYCSNTKYFYQRGWMGINVEPIPGSKAIFEHERPADINLELLVSENEGDAEFYLFEPSLMNTMSKEQSEANKKFEWCKFKGTTRVQSMPLAKLLDEHLPAGKQIDFMSIDVEGAEMSVLRSNNWEKYAPNVLLVEIINTDIAGVFNTTVHSFLSNLNYNFFAKTGNTLFYKKKGFFEFK